MKRNGKHNAEILLKEIDSQPVIMPGDTDDLPEKSKPKNTNGKKNKDCIKETIKSEADSKPSSTVTKFVPNETTEDDLEKELEYQRLQLELQEEAKIPGNGWFLGNIKDKHLPLMTVLADRGEVITMALGKMQENMLNNKRTESLFEMFIKDIMRLNISVKGRGRDDATIARQQDADRNATLDTARDLTGRRL